MKVLKCMGKRLAVGIQPTNILWCLFYIALAITLYLDLMVWRP